MKMHWAAVTGTALVAGAIHGAAWAQANKALAPTGIAEQQEADYRVIAARCGSPAFEHAFDRQSRRMVAAGLIAAGRSPKDVEASITSLRRNSFVLVAASADCPAQLAQLADLQRHRSAMDGMRGKAGAR